MVEDEDLLRYKAKKTPAILEDSLPHGRTEYVDATLLNAVLRQSCQQGVLTRGVASPEWLA